jgi:hypothetical protein
MAKVSFERQAGFVHSKADAAANYVFVRVRTQDIIDLKGVKKTLPETPVFKIEQRFGYPDLHNFQISL